MTSSTDVGRWAWRPDGRVRSAVVWAVVLSAGAATGAAVALGPATALAAVGLLALGALAVVGGRIVLLFHGALLVVLIGYAALNRGFAYIGTGGLFVGELVLALAAVTLLVRLPRMRFGAGEALIIVFMAWGAARTIPYIGTYQLDAFRDAVAWGYALIALAISATLRPQLMAAGVRVYRRLALPIVVWLPIAAVTTILLGESIPRAPGGDVPIIEFKAGDAGVHLGGVAAFVLTGLYGGRLAGIDRSVLLWPAWLVTFGLVAALNRGGMIAASMAVFSLVFIRRLNQWVVAVSVAAVIAAGAWLSNPQIDLGITRQLSFQQIVENATSIFVDRPTAQTQATKAWRIQWWESIVDYTVGGSHFWTGKGYGVNLADSDGFQVEEDGSLRSPHSAHLEILARSGVPGLALWLLLNAAVGVTLLRAGRAALRARRVWWAAVTAWIAVYWLGSLITMSVDVYLAGPMGGIWFWTVVGVAFALGRMVHEPEPRDEAASLLRTAPAPRVSARRP
jgi:hypothetical protein